MKICKKSTLLWIMSILSLILCLVAGRYAIISNHNSAYGGGQELGASNQKMHSEENYFLKGVKEKYTQDTGFLQCIESNVDMCVGNIAYDDKASLDCSDFTLEENKKLCQEVKIITKAQETKDIELCSTLENDKQGCQYEVTLVKGKDNYDLLSLCDSLEDGYKIICNNDIVLHHARKNKDEKICNKILSYNSNEDSEKQFCIDEVNYIIDEQKRLEEEEKLAQEFLEAAEQGLDPITNAAQ